MEEQIQKRVAYTKIADMVLKKFGFRPDPSNCTAIKKGMHMGRVGHPQELPKDIEMHAVWLLNTLEVHCKFFYFCSFFFQNFDTVCITKNLNYCKSCPVMYCTVSFFMGQRIFLEYLEVKPYSLSLMFRYMFVVC